DERQSHRTRPRAEITKELTNRPHHPAKQRTPIPPAITDSKINNENNASPPHSLIDLFP
ncbi:hypothetical protein BJV77DRAFT_986881, partial [Russula vinacea]